MYYMTRMTPAEIEEETLPYGWYLDIDASGAMSERYGLTQLNRHSYVKEVFPPGLFSVITLHNALPRADEQIARSTVQPQLKKLMEEQMLEVETKRDGFRSISGKNSYYLDYLCTRSGDSLNSYDYFRVRGEI